MSPVPIVKDLIVVAGPSFSGKSTFIRRLRRGKLPAMQQALGIDRVGEWVFQSATTVGELGEIRVDRMILHYDITRLLKESQPWWRVAPIEVMKGADTLTVVNIWTPPEVLLSRLRSLIRLVHMAKAFLDRQPIRLLRFAVRDAWAGTLPAHVRYALQSLLTRRIRSRLRKVGETGTSCRLRESLYSDECALRALYADWISFCEGLRPAAQHCWSGHGPASGLTDVSTITSGRPGGVEGSRWCRRSPCE